MVADGPDLGTLTALVAAQDAVREQLGQQASGLTQLAVADFGGWYTTDAITAWAGEVAGNVGVVLKALAGMVDAYLATIIGELTGQHMRPAGTVNIDTLRTGITPAGAYGRVADAYRWQQAQLDQAARALLTAPTPTPPTLISPREAAAERAAAVANLDTQLVVQKQSQHTMRAAGEKGLVTGWRRILHPELSKGGSCGLCVAASTRIYRTDHLMPIHHGCHCLPMPITAAHDPGSIINDSDLGRIYGDAGGSTTAADLKRTRYQVDSHGELGPVLNPAGAKVRTARQAKRDEGRPSRRPNTPTQQRAKLRQLHTGLASALTKADALAADDPQTWDSYRRILAERVTDLEQQLVA